MEKVCVGGWSGVEGDGWMEEGLCGVQDRIGG